MCNPMICVLCAKAFEYIGFCQTEGRAGQLFGNNWKKSLAEGKPVT